MNQITRGHLAGGGIVDRNGMNEFAGMLAIDEDDRNFHSGQHGNVDRTNARVENQDSVDAALFERVDNLELAVWIRVGVRQNNRKALGVRGVLGAADYFRDER